MKNRSEPPRCGHCIGPNTYRRKCPCGPGCDKLVCRMCWIEITYINEKYGSAP